MTDRDGLYVTVLPSGAITFRYDYRINKRRETLTLGKYGADGLSLAKAREKLLEARKLVSDEISPAGERRKLKNTIKNAESFEDFALRYIEETEFSDSTRELRRTTYQREIAPYFSRTLMHEISSEKIRHHCEMIVERGSSSDLDDRNLLTRKKPKIGKGAGLQLLSSLGRVNDNLNQIAKYINYQKLDNNSINFVKVLAELALIRTHPDLFVEQYFNAH